MSEFRTERGIEPDCTTVTPVSHHSEPVEMQVRRWEPKRVQKRRSGEVLRPPAIIEGLYRPGEVTNIISTTKAGKSWLSQLMMLCLAAGRAFLGWRVRKSNVLLLDNELHEWELEHRVNEIAAEAGFDLDDPELSHAYESLRGERINIHHIREQLGRLASQGLTFDVIIIDAKYKCFVEGMQENSNDDQALFHSICEQIAAEFNCALVLVHHATKGNQAGKSVTDIGAGGGSQSRAADNHVVIRDHEQEGLAVLECKPRTFPTPDPKSIRFDFPLWKEDDTLPVLAEPLNKQKKDRAEKDEQDCNKIPGFIRVEGSPLTVHSIRKALGNGRVTDLNRCKRLICMAQERGLIEESFDQRRGKMVAVYDVPKEPTPEDLFTN